MNKLKWIFPNANHASIRTISLVVAYMNKLHIMIQCCSGIILTLILCAACEMKKTYNEIKLSLEFSKAIVFEHDIYITNMSNKTMRKCSASYKLLEKDGYGIENTFYQGTWRPGETVHIQEFASHGIENPSTFNLCIKFEVSGLEYENNYSWSL